MYNLSAWLVEVKLINGQCNTFFMCKKIAFSCVHKIFVDLLLANLRKPEIYETPPIDDITSEKSVKFMLLFNICIANA